VEETVFTMSSSSIIDNNKSNAKYAQIWQLEFNNIAKNLLQRVALNLS
jgi:hypothetical protein